VENWGVAMPDRDVERSSPILAPRGTSAAKASSPETRLDESYHIYDSNPVPWWLTLVWLSFFVFGIGYLISNLLE
jgi:hypothetical protein